MIAAYEGFADYLRTLPLHESQHEIGGEGNATLFEYALKPTLDFYLSVLAHGDQIEVLEPEEVREEMRRQIQQLLSLYSQEAGKVRPLLFLRTIGEGSIPSEDLSFCFQERRYYTAAFPSLQELAIRNDIGRFLSMQED